MLTIGPVSIPAWSPLAVFLATLFGYLVYLSIRLLRPARGDHRNGGPALWPLERETAWYDSLTEPQPRYSPAPLEFDPPDPYLEQFDALLLSTRATFAAIHEFADAGLSSVQP